IHPLSPYICTQNFFMRTFLIFLFTVLGFIGYAQSEKELDKRNGFKDIKLLSDITTYDGLEYTKPLKNNPGHSIYKAKKGNYESIGDIDIYNLVVYAYKNQVYQINITTKKEEKLFRSLEKAFGKVNTSLITPNPYWDGENVRLIYIVIGSKKITLSYQSKKIRQIIASDKKKAVENLTTEF
ncbi:MAG: hypothetical protein ABFS35_24030, partial [Bacteroidota bacterium]